VAKAAAKQATAKAAKPKAKARKKSIQPPPQPQRAPASRWMPALLGAAIIVLFILLLGSFVWPGWIRGGRTVDGGQPVVAGNQNHDLRKKNDELAKVAKAAPQGSTNCPQGQHSIGTTNADEGFDSLQNGRSNANIRQGTNNIVQWNSPGAIAATDHSVVTVNVLDDGCGAPWGTNTPTLIVRIPQDLGPIADQRTWTQDVGPGEMVRFDVSPGYIVNADPVGYYGPPPLYIAALVVPRYVDVFRYRQKYGVGGSLAFTQLCFKPAFGIHQSVRMNCSYSRIGPVYSAGNASSHHGTSSHGNTRH
jgi:hypothetical protein